MQWRDCLHTVVYLSCTHDVEPYARGGRQKLALPGFNPNRERQLARAYPT
jgi:hypothetical protein